MENQSGTESTEEQSTNNKIACISGKNISNNKIKHIGTVINYTFENENAPISNKTLNCLSAAACFKGRSEILTDIDNYFKNTTHNIVVIYGAPGIGKTETARQFTVEKAADFSGNIIWIFSETEENIKKCFHDLSASLCLKVSDVSQVYGKFRQSPCLFIFDNVENISSIKQYLPPTHLRQTVKIIITSQFSEWDCSFAKLHLKPLNLDISLEIFKDKLKDFYQEYQDEMLKDLLYHLEGIPLSIQIVASIIKEEFSKVRISRLNLQNFVCDLKEKFINTQISVTEINNYNKTVFSSIRFALERLKKEETKHSLDLLRFAAYLNADDISHEYLLFVPSIENSKVKLEASLTLLKQYSLIQVECNNNDELKIKIHRTIQHVLRKFDLNEQNGSMFKTLLKTLLLGKMFFHFDSVFKYVKHDEFKNKSLEFYYENYIVNRTLTDSYLKKLAYYKCDGLLTELLPKFKQKHVLNDNYNKILNELLYWAIINRSDELFTIKLLIKHGAKIEISDGKTNAFHLAVSWLSAELFDCLLHSSDSKNVVNSKDYLGRTVLHLLIEKCNEDNMKNTIECMKHLILNWKADISIRYGSDTILHTVCNNKNVCCQMIKLLVEKCNCKYLINEQNEKGETPLHNLPKYNNRYFEILFYFLKKCDADISIKDKYGWNTLFNVCRFETSGIVDFVLRNRNCREFINDRDIKGNVAFTQLIYNKRIKEPEKIELLELFVENKLDFKTRNIREETFEEIAEKKNLVKLAAELKNHLKVSSRRTFCILKK